MAAGDGSRPKDRWLREGENRWLREGEGSGLRGERTLTWSEDSSASFREGDHLSMEVDRLATLVRERQPCIVLTGAAISTESGLPDLRSRAGLWARYDPFEVAHVDAFRRDPARIWEFYALRLDLLGRARPNDGHRALAELERRGWVQAVVTQNVDG
jgi:hypothetical protein